jgi:hypothetical protein
VRPTERLSERDLGIVAECLRAAVDGPFFPEWEFHALFGLSREEVRSVLSTWPQTSDTEMEDIAVNNALNNLLGYPHDEAEAWRKFISVDSAEVGEVLARWRGDDTFDPRGKGYFDRMK